MPNASLFSVSSGLTAKGFAEGGLAGGLLFPRHPPLVSIAALATDAHRFVRPEGIVGQEGDFPKAEASEEGADSAQVIEFGGEPRDQGHTREHAVRDATG
jgi:hypothetical protein